MCFSLKATYLLFFLPPNHCVTKASLELHTKCNQAITGLGAAYATGLFHGPIAAIAFTIGSCIGYVLASWYYLRTSMQEALSAFELYPKLMVMHMANNYMNYGFEQIRMESAEDKVKFRERLRTSLTLRCFMLSSYHTAAPAIDVS